MIDQIALLQTIFMMFNGLSNTLQNEHDCLVERWRPESHIFHLPVGECIITLEDVALQLGLHVDGRPTLIWMIKTCLVYSMD
ncbi:hypothetical protein JHK85_053471 [Glycine max]|nr:hypothetical protein JHK85_053471 [Glycine max]